MKKALSIILSVLVIFSVFSMAVSAADSEIVTVKFMVDDVVYYEIEVEAGKNFVHRLQQGETKLEAPTKESTEATEYIFEHWVNEATGETTLTANVPAAYEDTVYVAVFAEKDIIETQSLWAFIRSIFERINMIFEYFAKVFEGVFDF